MKNIILLITTILLFVSCEYENTPDCHQIVTLTNNTNEHLYILTSFDNSLVDEIKYHPDPLLDPSTARIEALEKNSSMISGRTCFEVKLRNSTLGFMRVYFIDGVKLEASTWGKVLEDSLILKTYDLTLEDLQMLDYKISYPPTEDMKYIKMYPKYEE